MEWPGFVGPVFLYYLPLAIAGAACLYHLAVTVAALRFHSEKEPTAAFSPPVSVLKPLRGIEPDFYSTLSTFFLQQYPNYEIIFGLSDPSDPARWTIAQLQRDFPEVPVKIVHAMGTSGANPKMGKLQRMVDATTHETLVISDADIAVGPDYLQQIVRPLASERVGMVTCLYRGIRSGGLRSILEALGMSAEFAGQVLLGRALTGMRFGLGATMATRKKQIAEIGGLAPWSDYLADDYILGNRIAAAGYGVHLSHTCVETLLPRRTWAEFLHQQLRWARTIRACSRGGYTGLLFAFGAPLALISALYHPSRLSLAALCAALALRSMAAWVCGSLGCKDPLARRYFWLSPLRDLLALIIWVVSFAGNSVVWRGARFRLEPNGKMRPA